MKLGFGNDGEEIYFAVNKEEDQCVDFGPRAPFLEPFTEGLMTDSTGIQSMEGRDDPCKFWACVGGLPSDKCEQYDRVWSNWAVWFVNGYSNFAACVQRCDCPTGSTKYLGSTGGGNLLVICCDDATEEIRLDKFGSPEAVLDDSGAWKLECKPKCLAPPCGQWYCKGSGSPGVGEIGCAQWTDGESTPPEGVEFYPDQSACEFESKCGQWWCNGSGVCQLVTQADPFPPGENWSGRIFESKDSCEDFGCGKYYCDIAQDGSAECQKIDGAGGSNRPEGSTLFDEYENCMSSCGKWYCVGPPEVGSEPISCSRVISNTNPDSYSAGLFEDESSCHEVSGCSDEFKWICSDSLCQKVKVDEVDTFTWADGVFTYAQCRLAFSGCCPPGSQYDPSTDQCKAEPA
jgi:hypothetical protein